MTRIHRGPMTGRTVLVTGATGGIGKATAAGLSAMGAHLAITGRDRGRTEAAARDILAAGGGPVDVSVEDLSAQAEVRRLTAEVLERLARLDVLVNNVGGYWNTRHVTADGLERTFALNHLAPFLLTNLLLDRLAESAPGRVVTVASNAHTLGRLRRPAGRTILLRFAGPRPVQARQRAVHVPTDRGLRSTPVTSNAVHPGTLDTAFGAEDPGDTPAPARPIHPAVHEIPSPGRRHLHPRGLRARARPCDRPLLRQQRSSERSYDEVVAAQLWQVSVDPARPRPANPPPRHGPPTPDPPLIRGHAALLVRIEVPRSSR
jgi:retinol dehydrogenase-14